MFWIVIAILVTGYLIAQAIKNSSPKLQKNNIDSQITVLEEKASHYLNVAIEKEKKNIVRFKKELSRSI